MPADDEEQGKEKLRGGEIDVYVVLEGDLGGKGGTLHFYTFKTKASQMDAMWTVERLLRDAVVDSRYRARGIDRAVLAEVQNVPIRRVELGTEQGKEKVQSEGQRVARMMVPFAFMYLIFIGIVGMGQHMISSIIEEKNSRIIEMLLSAVSPFELMAGKILGLAGVGLTVMILWGLAAYGTATWRGINIDIGPDLVVYGLAYYVLGFILFSAILAGVGSVCNTIKETQSLMMPITMIFVIPIIAWPQLARDPNGDLARVLTYIPPTTPMLMVLRLSSSPDIWWGEIAISFLVLVGGVFVAIWAAGKVFRTGILMYGKRPRPPRDLPLAQGKVGLYPGTNARRACPARCCPRQGRIPPTPRIPVLSSSTGTGLLRRHPTASTRGTPSDRTSSIQVYFFVRQKPTEVPRCHPRYPLLTIVRSHTLRYTTYPQGCMPVRIQLPVLVDRARRRQGGVHLAIRTDRVRIQTARQYREGVLPRVCVLACELPFDGASGRERPAWFGGLDAPPTTDSVIETLALGRVLSRWTRTRCWGPHRQAS